MEHVLAFFSDDEGPDDDSFEQFIATSKQKPSKNLENRSAIDLYEPDSVDLDESFEQEIAPPKKSKRSRADKDESKSYQPQCLGPQCCKSARKKSKYCSDRCGMNLAAKRIERFLLPKIDEFTRNPSVATIEQMFKLEQLKADYNAILKVFNKLYYNIL